MAFGDSKHDHKLQRVDDLYVVAVPVPSTQPGATRYVGPANGMYLTSGGNLTGPLRVFLQRGRRGRNLRGMRQVAATWSPPGEVAGAGGARE